MTSRWDPRRYPQTMKLTLTSGSHRTARNATSVVSGASLKAGRSFLIAALALLLLALAASTASASTSVAPCPQQFGSFTAQTPPPGCWRPYGSSSPFNKPIPAGAPVASDSGVIMRQMTSSNVGFAGGKQGFQLDSQGSRPIYWAQPSDPMVTIHCTYLWGPRTCQGANGVVVDGLQIHIPAGAQPEQASDGHLTVIDQAAGAEYDFEHASWTSPTELTVASGSEIPISGNAGTGLGGNADAGDFGLLGGVIRASELKAGVINHALAISVPCTQGYVWPSEGPWGLACGSIGRSSSGALHMGSLLQLNMSARQIAATGAPAWEQTIMRAMAQYGLYVNDTNGGGDDQTLELETQDDVSFTSFGASPQLANYLSSLGGRLWSNGAVGLGGLPINTAKLRVIAPCIAQGTCAATAVAHAARAHSRKRGKRGHKRARHAKR